MDEHSLKVPVENRRSRGLGPNDVGRLTGLLTRIERENVHPDVSKHNTKFVDRDENWQRAYNLLNHLGRVGNVTFKVCVDMGFKPYEIEIGRFGGSLHDLGKLDESCEMYRLIRRLTDEEFLTVGRHSEFTAIYLRSLMPFIRKEDHPFLEDVILVTQDHHKCYRITKPNLRKVGYVLKTCDAFVTLQEDRGNKLGMNTEQALAALHPLDFVLREQDANHIPYLEFMDKCVASLKKLYSLNLE